MTAIVVVGMSEGVSCSDYVSKKLDKLLGNIDEYELHSVNDTKNILKEYASRHGRKIVSRSCDARVTAKQIIAKATYLVVFWTGFDLSELLFFAALLNVKTKIVPIPLTIVANRDKNQVFDVYIGRGSPWGNPFPIDNALDVDRNKVIERYKEYFNSEILGNPDKKKQLEGLRGLRLGCHCKPLPCHGDVIANYLNGSIGIEEPT